MVESAGAAGNVVSKPLSMTQIAGYVNKYFPPEARATAVAIAWHESRGNPLIVNDKNNTPAGSRDRGIFQLNDHWNPDVPDSCAFDPECATAYAAKLYKEQGWKPWATFARGAYRPFLEQAEAAVEQAGKNPAGATTQAGFLPDWVPTPSDAIDAVGAIPGTIGDAFGFIAKAFSVLTSGDFWKRAGLIVVGVSIVGVSIVVIKRDAIVGAVTGAPAGATGAAAGAAKGEARSRAKRAAKKTADADADASGGRPAENVQAGDNARSK